MGIGKDYDPTKPISSDNTPSPFKDNPELAREVGRKGGLAKANRTQLQKDEAKLRKQMLKTYQEKLEVSLAKMNKILAKVEKELLTPVQREITLPDGKSKFIDMPLSEGKLELLLKYQKQLHEQVLGKPKQIVDGKIDVPITLIINEEKEPIDVSYIQVEETKIPDNLKIEEEKLPD